MCTTSGIPVTVVMPIVAPIMKVQSCRQFGAKIIIHVNKFEKFSFHLALGQT